MQLTLEIFSEGNLKCRRVNSLVIKEFTIVSKFFFIQVMLKLSLVIAKFPIFNVRMHAIDS